MRADARAVSEALYNIVENAAKYSPASSAITIAAARKDDIVSISINDAGPGIPTSKREAVFEKFVRLNGLPHTGLGLGLAIAKAIIEAQNGSITITDGDGRVGTKVVIELQAEAEN